MSSGQVSRQRSHSTRSTTSKRSGGIRQTPPPASLTPDNGDSAFEPCAATASFLLYAQRSQILVLHHDTLTIERRFALHREDVLWIAVDNVSERGSGRLAVSFDVGKTAIVWDILSGGEVARFSAYEHMRVASFMRNGNIAFGMQALYGSSGSFAATDSVQQTIKGTSSFSNLPHRNMSRHARYSILSLQSRQHQIAERLRLGT